MSHAAAVPTTTVPSSTGPTAAAATSSGPTSSGPTAAGRATDMPTTAAFLVVLDADSTLFHDEVIDLLAEHAGATEAVAAITERAMRGELDFAASLRERAGLLAGLSVDAFDAVRERVRVTDGAQELVAGVHAAGGRIGVVSGGFHEVLDPFASLLGLDAWRANRLATQDGRLTGAVDGPIVDAHGKAAALRAWAEDAGIPIERTIAVGDGANDLEMMDVAALAVAFNAKPRVRAAADVAIDRQDLSQVLPLLGLRG